MHAIVPPRQDDAASTKKSLLLAWRPGIAQARLQPRRSAAQLSKSRSTRIAESKCDPDPGRQKDQKMLETMCGTGCWPDGRRAERQDDNGPGGAARARWPRARPVEYGITTNSPTQVSLPFRCCGCSAPPRDHC